ncbi:hypothetical protein CDQ75_09310, partial [Campylobacter hyointestinalis subsp. hyointestinalis]
IDHSAIAASGRQCDCGSAVPDVDGQGGGGGVCVAVGERVGKYIALATLRACVAGIAVGAVRCQCQHTVGTVDGDGASSRHIDAGRTKLHLGDDGAVCTLCIGNRASASTGDHVTAGLGARRCNSAYVVAGHRYVVHYADDQAARCVGTAIGVGDQHCKAGRGRIARAVVCQRVAVVDGAYASGSVEAVVRRQLTQHTVDELWRKRLRCCGQRMAAQRDRAHETAANLVCRLMLEKKKKHY